MKNFPRIHSLGAINIIHHTEFLYDFHPIRTDFVGDSGAGKSIVTDLIQLILIGSTHYKSATSSKKKRPFTGLVLSNEGSANFAYAFLNIEVRDNKFLTIGTYIEKSSNQSQTFIIQKGFDFDGDKLVSFDEPVVTDDFEENENWLPITDLPSKFDKDRNLGFKRFSKFQNYHLLLSKNDLLPINIEQTSSLRDYAKILQAFSRKGIDTEDSLELKKFLFGEEQQSRYYKRYDEIVLDLKGNEDDFLLNQKEIKSILEKEKELNILEKRDIEAQKILIQANIAEWSFAKNERKKLKKIIKKKLTKYANAKSKILQLEDLSKAKQKLIVLELDSLKKELDTKKDEIKPLQNRITIISQIQEFLDERGLVSTEDIRAYHSTFIKNKQQSILLNKLETSLKVSDLVKEFKELKHTDGYNKVIETIIENNNRLKEEFKILTASMAFNNYKNENSLARWVIDSSISFSKEQESIIKHFQDIRTDKPIDPKDGSAYIPNPDEIINCKIVKIKGEKPSGFYLHLSGYVLYVEYVAEQLFNTQDKSQLISLFDANRKELEIQQNVLEFKFKQGKKLQDLLQKLPQVEDSIIAYIYRDTIRIEQQDYQNQLLLKSTDDLDFSLVTYEEKNKYEPAFVKVESEITQIKIRQNNLTKLAEDLKENPTIKLQPISEEASEVFNKYNVNIEAVHTFNIDENNYFLEFYKEYNNAVSDINELNEALSLHQNRLKIDESIERLLFENDYLKANVKRTDVTEDEVKQLKANTHIALSSFKTKYDDIVEEFVENESNSIKESYSFEELVRLVLPGIYKDVPFHEKDIMKKIPKYLEEINQRNAELDKNKIFSIRDLLGELRSSINRQTFNARKIDGFFTKGYGKISGGHTAKLEYPSNKSYSIDWINDFLEDIANNEESLFPKSKVSDEAQIEQYKSIEEKLKEAYKHYSTSPSSSALVKDILNPFSYYDLKYEIKTASKKEVSGSTGQTYTATALLCISKLSVVQGYENVLKPGLRFMCIDEAEGIGSNYDLLMDVADEFDYQVISLSIRPVSLNEGKLNIYRLYRDKSKDFVNHIPIAIQNLDL